jgi:SDR family mycofactocin-dependent oxidoreductase
MTGKLAGKVVVITGGARGVGRSHAVAFAREGADVAVCDIAEQIPSVHYPMAVPADLKETVRLVEGVDRRCLAVTADVRNLEQMTEVADRAMAEFGRIDILLANAGVASYESSTLELREDEWDDMISVNLGGVWRAAKAVVPHIVAGGRGGSVVLTSSTAGLKGYAGIGHYVASKHGMVGLMRTLAIELAGHSIRVNSLHPTGINTPMIHNDYLATQRASPAWASPQVNLLPVGLIEPEDVSAAALWLCSDEARFITGVSLPVDAGFVTR